MRGPAAKSWAPDQIIRPPPGSSYKPKGIRQMGVPSGWGVAFAAFVLLFAWGLGFNLGLTVEESSALRKVGHAKGRIEAVRERLAMCTENNQKVINGHSSEKTTIDHLLGEMKVVERENSVLEETIKDADQAVRQCQSSLADERERRTGTRNTNASEALLEFRYEQQRLATQIGEANVSLAERPRLLQLIRAYLHENNELAQKLEALREATPAPTPVQAEVTQAHAESGGGEHGEARPQHPRTRDVVGEGESTATSGESSGEPAQRGAADLTEAPLVAVGGAG